jgi:hypothetical protein
MGMENFMRDLAGVILIVFFFSIWCYGIARAETGWKYVPVVGSFVGGVKIMEDYAIPKK